MTKLLDSTLVLCDLDHLLLAGDGNMPQVVRDVLQLFSSRGGRLTVFSQRSPRAVRFDSELPEYFTHFIASLRRGTV